MSEVCTVCRITLDQDANACHNCGTVVVKTADTTQAGGSHYKDMAVQPWHLMEALLTPEEFIGYLRGNMIKYAMRQGRKDSPDAEKYHHYKQKLAEVKALGTKP